MSAEKFPAAGNSMSKQIDAAITEQTATLIEENERLRALPGEVLAQFLQWMVRRDVEVMIGCGGGADALARPAVAFLKANGLSQRDPKHPKLKTPGRVVA